MIHALASIQVKEENLDTFLAIFRANVSNVKAELGCIEYVPTIDAVTDIPIQQRQPSVVTVIEKWESIAALLAHLETPHMIAYKQATRDMVVQVAVKILRGI